MELSTTQNIFLFGLGCLAILFFPVLLAVLFPRKTLPHQTKLGKVARFESKFFEGFEKWNTWPYVIRRLFGFQTNDSSRLIKLLRFLPPDILAYFVMGIIFLMFIPDSGAGRLIGIGVATIFYGIYRAVWNYRLMNK